MSAGEIGSIASAVVAFVALIVSLISMHKTNKFGEATDRLNRLLIDRETADTLAEKKAEISANLYQQGRTTMAQDLQQGKGLREECPLD